MGFKSMFNVTLNGAVLLTGGLGTEVIREEAQLRGGQCGGQAISQHRRFCLVHIMGTCQADFWYKKRSKPSETCKELTKNFHPCKIGQKEVDFSNACVQLNSGQNRF